MQAWKRLGLVVDPQLHSSQGITHAAVPFGEFVGADLFKIYFSSRDSHQRSFGRYVVIDLKKKFEIAEFSSEAVLGPGEAGYFDDSGAMPTCLINFGDADFMYYIGWNLGRLVPFRNALGLALRKKGESKFVKAFNGPVIDRSPFDPSFVASCTVVNLDGQLIMYYASCDGWFDKDGTLEHRYNIKIASSTDGIKWAREGKIAIDYANDSEYAICTPTIIKDSRGWRMWFSCRGDRYRIGYAESQDGISWQRKDEEMSELNQSGSGFDSEMCCYPFVIEYEKQLLMLYNGNGYGKSGIGAAVLDLES